jgi:hypothetical protein
MPGMQAALGGIMAGAEAKQELQRSQQLEAKREELSNLYQTGTPDEVGEFFIKNPDLAKEFDVAKTAADKMTREEEVSKAWDIYTGKVDPASGAMEHAEEILSRGGNAAESLQLAEMSQRDPEIAKRAAAGVLARYDTEGYKAYRESQGMGVDRAVPKQKTGAFLVKDPQGNTSVAVGSYDPSTGKLTTETAAFSGLDVVSKLGETAAEETERKIGQKGGEVAATGKEQRASTLIERGVTAAESSATVRRAIELLDTVDTGGLDAVNLRARQIFGVEGADAGELSNSLGKAVLSQLKETFGAAFTVEEGARLERIEAGFGKSPATNKRLLEQSLRIINRTARRARSAAEERGDTATVEDIDDLLSFSLSNEPPTEPVQEQQPIATPAQPQADQQPASQYTEGQTATGAGGQKLIFRNGNWGPM